MIRIDPWSSEDIADYKKLMSEFGMGPFEAGPLAGRGMPPVMARGYVVGQRGYKYIADAIMRREAFAMLTGLMPSGSMHFGHKMVIDQVMYYQRMGGDIFVAVADIEAYATRDVPLSKAREVALEEYVKSYIALGLKQEKCEIYFQSRRRAVKDIPYILGRYTNLSTMRAIYDYRDSINMSHALAPLVQVGDILHVQMEEYGGPRPTIVPVGLDQDPHIRFTRDLASASRLFSVQDTPKGTGIFLKGQWDEGEADKTLARLKSHLTEAGYADIGVNVPYRALYLGGREDTYLLLRLLSPLEIEMGGYGFLPPSATYHRFMHGLNGGKMSSSRPDSAIFLSDTVEDARKKILRAITGGRTTAEEQRALGGVPESCTVFEMLLLHLVPDDKDLEEIYNRCRNGEMLCGECKKDAARRLSEFLTEFQERKKGVDNTTVEEYLAED